MEDRIPANPGRVLVTPENGGAAYYATLTRADNPTQEGTPLNKANLLTDATAALFGLGANAVPNDVFSTVRALIARNATDIANGVKIATGSYTGTGNYDSSNKNTLAFGFKPQFVLIVECSIEHNNGAYNAQVRFVSPMTVPLMMNIYGGVIGSQCTVTWTDTGVTWYSTENAKCQGNTSGKTYQYLAIG